MSKLVLGLALVLAPSEGNEPSQDLLDVNVLERRSFVGAGGAARQADGPVALVLVEALVLMLASAPGAVGPALPFPPLHLPKDRLDNDMGRPGSGPSDVGAAAADADAKAGNDSLEVFHAPKSAAANPPLLLPVPSPDKQGSEGTL